MKSLRLIALAAALALQANAAGAASPARMSGRTPAQDAVNYYVPNLTDSAGTSTPIMQIPGSVVVIPRQVIEDQQAITVCDALRNVSGVFCR